MSKYEVLIARSETTIYTVRVNASNEQEAETKAYDRYAKGYWASEEVIEGDEETHEINYLGESQNA